MINIANPKSYRQPVMKYGYLHDPHYFRRYGLLDLCFHDRDTVLMLSHRLESTGQYVYQKITLNHWLSNHIQYKSNPITQTLRYE